MPALRGLAGSRGRNGLWACRKKKCSWFYYVLIFSPDEKFAMVREAPNKQHCDWCLPIFLVYPTYFFKVLSIFQQFQHGSPCGKLECNTDPWHLSPHNTTSARLVPRALRFGNFVEKGGRQRWGPTICPQRSSPPTKTATTCCWDPAHGSPWSLGRAEWMLQKQPDMGWVFVSPHSQIHVLKS